MDLSHSKSWYGSYYESFNQHTLPQMKSLDWWKYGFHGNGMNNFSHKLENEKWHPWQMSSHKFHPFLKQEDISTHDNAKMAANQTSIQLKMEPTANFIKSEKEDFFDKWTKQELDNSKIEETVEQIGEIKFKIGDYSRTQQYPAAFQHKKNGVRTNLLKIILF